MSAAADIDAQFAELDFDAMEDVQPPEDKFAAAPEEEVRAQPEELLNAAEEADAKSQAEPAPEGSSMLVPEPTAPPATSVQPATKPLPKPASKSSTAAQLKKPLVTRVSKKAEPVAEGSAVPCAAAQPAPAPKPEAKPLKLRKNRPAPEADADADDDSAEAERDVDEPVAKGAKPKKLAPAPKPAKAAAAAPARAKKAACAAGPKHPVTAYTIFLSTKRDEVQAAHPDMSKADVIKHLGEMYKKLSREERAPLEELVAQDKARYAREVEATSGPAHKPKRTPKTPRVKTAYELYCQQRRPELAKEHPKAGMGEMSKLLSEEWHGVSEEERAPFVERSNALKEAAKADRAQHAEGAENGEDSQAPAAAKPKKRSRAAGASGGRKRAKAGAASGGEASDDEQGAAVETPADDDEEEIDRENVDWEAHPAVAILSKTLTHYVVLRRGLPLHEYGEVQIGTANMQRAGQAPEGGKPCPVSVEMVEDYENFTRGFKRDVHAATQGNELVLEALPEGTSLEACSFLGDMRAGGGELQRLEKKNDVWMKVPMMPTSRLLQRLVGVMRREAEGWRQRCERAEAALAKAQGAGAQDGQLTSHAEA